MLSSCPLTTIVFEQLVSYVKQLSSVVCSFLYQSDGAAAGGGERGEQGAVAVAEGAAGGQEAVAGQEGAGQQRQPTAGESFMAITKSLVIRALIIYFITSFFRYDSHPYVVFCYFYTTKAEGRVF